MEFLKTVLFCIVAACVYGILHDQITVRISLEYFTIGHPMIMSGLLSPTALAVAWGIIATWWVGLILGILIAVSAHVGSRPKLAFRSVVRPVLSLLAVMAVLAAVAGVIGNLLASGGSVWLMEPQASQVPRERHVGFLTALWCHSASYLVGFVGGIVICVRLFLRRSAAASSHKEDQ